MRNNLNYQLLKDLCQVHSVTGDTQQIVKYLINYLKKNKIKFHQDSFGTILAGNLKAKKMFAAHIDEVGFQVTKIEESGKIRVLPVGWVFANRLDHAVVYLDINGARKNGVILHEEILKEENIKSFNSLYLDLGYESREEVESVGVKPGMTGSFQREFIENGKSIIAAGIDNKISVWTILALIEENRNVLKDNLFAFTTDEEMQDHSANGLCFKYQPDVVYVLDYCPIHESLGKAETLGESGKGSLVMYRGGQYILHPEIRDFFENKIKAKFQKGFLSSDTLPSLEPNNFEDNGHTKAVNVCIPAFGYHGSAYSVRKVDIENFYELVQELAMWSV